MSAHPDVMAASIASIKENGVGSGGTRNIGGNNSAIVDLEAEIANLHNREAALVFTSGYVANDAALTALARILPEIVFFSDESNHASIISGIRASRVEKHIYNHLDMASLEEKLSSVDINRPKAIIFESVYSMDGLLSPMKKIIDLAKKYNALTYVDEVHSVGLYGKGGAGLADELGIADQIDIIQGTFAKAYGTIGGYVSGNKNLIDAIRLSAHSFIFTTSLPPSIAEAARKSITHLKHSNKERELLKDRVETLKKSLDKSGIKYFKNESHIVPIMIGDPFLSAKISKKLLDEHSMYVQHINYPTVPKGTERLRITITPHHTDAMIDNLTSSLLKVFEDVGLKEEEAA
jgi:5-aminolevulinate synthase